MDLISNIWIREHAKAVWIDIQIIKGNVISLTPAPVALAA